MVRVGWRLYMGFGGCCEGSVVRATCGSVEGATGQGICS